MHYKETEKKIAIIKCIDKAIVEFRQILIKLIKISEKHKKVEF